ncbi:MAG: CPBP family intramembrane metalloprotease [Clostridia bacterium]|nr:CPBP family intramembrane metalloprotease [Clostridia bacterium]
MYNFYDAENSVYIKKEKEKKQIKRIGIAAGASVIGYVLIQNILSMLIYLSPIGEIYETDPAMQSVVSIFLSVFGIALPFGIAGYFLNKGKDTPVVDFRKPVSTPLMLSAACLGFFICLAGNYVTGIFVNFMDELGILLSSPEYYPPTDFAGRIIYTVSIAVVPALVEEFAVRGVILQPLRKFGDKFAIIATALLFAVMHGNLIQAPFALIAGIGIGYAVCITNSIRTGFLIHFCNNLYSVIVEFLVADIADENKLNTVYLVLTAALYAVTIGGSVIFVILKKQRKLVPSFTLIKESEKMRAFILTIPMIIALLLMIYITSGFVDFGR